jgi:RNA polymerase sigma-70 factor (ECF subfamily)
MLPGFPPDAIEGQIRALWLCAQAGDDQAYHAALALVAARLRGFFASRWAAMPDNVDDLVQETLLALHLQRATYDPRLPLGSWVFAIARHKLVDAWRRYGRREALHEPLDGLAEAAQPVLAAEGCAGRDVLRLLATLPAAQHRAIVLTKLSGLTLAEASARTGVSVSALKVQVHRGLKKLAEAIRPA